MVNVNLYTKFQISAFSNLLELVSCVFNMETIIEQIKISAGILHMLIKCYYYNQD